MEVRRGSGENAGMDSLIDHATPAANMAIVDETLARKSFALEFPPVLENMFQAEITSARFKNFLKLTSIGIAVYNLFLFTDYLMMRDIFPLIVITQLGIVTPILVLILYSINRRILRANVGIVSCMLIILGSILLFYSLSRSEYVQLVIFTVPIAMAYGNIVLPLAFRSSVVFTSVSLVASTLVVVLKEGNDLAIAAFILLSHSTIGLFMVFSTYRSESNERKTYLLTLRERFRSDMLADVNEKLKILAEIDSLTGVYNRRYFDQSFDRLWKSALHSGQPLAIGVIDIDHFKKLNDQFGHQEGDSCLKAVAQCLQAALMPHAMLARYGGEEFVVLMPGMGASQARRAAEALREAVAGLALTSADGVEMRMTVSIGTCAMVPTPALPRHRLVTEADQALYRAKANGRNRVERARSQVRDAWDDSVTASLYPSI